MRLVVIAAVAFGLGAFAACAIGTGEGQVRGTVSVPMCGLSGSYELQPSFFGAQRFGTTLSIRIQAAGGVPDYTDGLTLQIDDTEEVARRIAAGTERDAEGRPVATLRVGPAGTPDVLVHALFSPVRSCGRIKVSRLAYNVGLWAYEGTITFRSIDRGPNPQNPQPGDGARITDVTAFDFRLHDPRPAGSTAPAGVAPDAPIGEAQLQGNFRYQYSNGVPSQPFTPTPESP